MWCYESTKVRRKDSSCILFPSTSSIHLKLGLHSSFMWDILVESRNPVQRLKHKYLLSGMGMHMCGNGTHLKKSPVPYSTV